ncbi:MAG TPA: serine hydrolase domain-containing protein [Thermoanaerobaculia bacterium]|nr:serine hydrolase domain-containing protein [Thermoanaerobaculia bacterium]
MSRLAVLLLLLAGCATGGPHVDALLRDYDGDVPGASVLVIDDGRVVVRKAYGLADVKAKRPAMPATNYRLASITKQFTAAAILELNLNLDDDIRKWLPSLPVQGVTVRHLLTHTSGLIDYEDVIPEGTTAQLRDADVLRLLELQDRTYFTPGTSYRYSNSGYALLALIVEKASGQSFATFLRGRIFRPLRMHNTVAFEDGVSSVPNRAYGTPRDQSLTSAVLGDGGIYSSVDDLAKWDAALYDPKYEIAFAPRTKTDDPSVEYGFGWRISRHRGERMVWHSGETSGFRNVLIRFPARKLTVILLTNRADGEPYRIALAIAGAWIR